MLWSQKMRTCLVVSMLHVHMSSSQHWSYGLRPGGKRETNDNVMDSIHHATDNVDSMEQYDRAEQLYPDCRANTVAKFVPGWKTADANCHQVSVQREEYQYSPGRDDCQHTPSSARV